MTLPSILPPGTKFGSLVIETPCGSDESGQLYTAHIEPGKVRAQVRVLSAQNSAAGSALNQILKKLEKYAACKSPHLAQMVAFNQIATIQRWLIVTSVGNATTLAERVLQKNLTPPAVVAIMKQALMGLKCAHENNLVHGDLNLENIVIAVDGKVKITNFAFAGVSASGRNERIDYQAPELLDSGISTVSTDIFALGIVFNKLFQSLGVARFPIEMRRVAERMYAQNPNNRFESAADALQMFGVGATADAQEDANKIIARSFERTKTIQLKVDREIREARVRDKLPSPIWIAVIAAIAFFGFTKIKPMFKGKNFAEASKELVANTAKAAKSMGGFERMEEAKRMAVEMRQEVEASDARKLANADAATNGEFSPTPPGDAPKNP